MPPKPPFSSLLVRHRALPPIHSTPPAPNSSDNKFSSSAKLHHSAQLFATHHNNISSNFSNHSIHSYLTPSHPASVSSGKQIISKTIRILPHPSDSSAGSNGQGEHSHHITSAPVSPKSHAASLKQQSSTGFTPLSSSSSSSAPSSTALIHSSPKPKMASPRNSKRDIHAPDFAYEVKFPVQTVPQNLHIPPEQQALMPNPDTDIAMKKYATSVDERNFLTVYEFMVNNQWVIWDYYTGYVHLTGLWKAIGNNKADIVKLVENSPDLEPLIRRVRGGFLKIQGTWLPFPIAKALASRTCYHIRFALIPIFGETFPDSCLQPHEPGFGQLQMHLSTTTKRRRKRTTLPPGHFAATGNNNNNSNNNQHSPNLHHTSIQQQQQQQHNQQQQQQQMTSSSSSSISPASYDMDGTAARSVTGAEPLPRKRTKSETYSGKPQPSNSLKRQYNLHLLSASPAASAVASPPLSHMAPPSSVNSPNTRTFYASPQAIPSVATYNSTSTTMDDNSMSSPDGACYSDDDEPLLMAPSSNSVSVVAAAAARSRRASNSYQQYRSRRHSSRLFSTSTTPSSSLPSSPTLMNQSYQTMHHHSHPHYMEPVTPPPMPIKLALANDAASASLADSPSEFVQVLQATRSLQQMSMSAAVAAANYNSNNGVDGSAATAAAPRLSFDPKNLGGGFEFAGKLWSWDGHEKLNIVGSAKGSPRVILPPPGSAPNRRPPTPPLSEESMSSSRSSLIATSVSQQQQQHNVMDISGLIS